jgi:hypothetical protein
MRRGSGVLRGSTEGLRLWELFGDIKGLVKVIDKARFSGVIVD